MQPKGEAMSLPLPPLRLTGAAILRDGRIERRSLGLAGGRIRRGAFPGVDLDGHYVLPGIVDLYGPAATDIAAADAALVAEGVTTAMLAQPWGWQGGEAQPDRAEARLAALASRRGATRADLRALIVVDPHLAGGPAPLVAAMDRHGVGGLLFVDPLEALIEARRDRPADFAAAAACRGVTPAALSAALDRARGTAGGVPRTLCALAEACDQRLLPYGSLADPDGEVRERHAMMGARIAVFPTRAGVAAAARAMMNPVVVSAAEVLAGGRAAGIVGQGLADAMASGGHPAALAAAAFALVRREVMDLARAWALISTGPAEILRMPDRGRLAQGMRADLTIVEAATGEVTATIVAGRLVAARGRAAEALLPRVERTGIAAE